MTARLPPSPLRDAGRGRDRRTGGLVRLVMIFNPLGIRFEVFNNPESYAAIAAEADGRPVVFRYGYASVAARICVLYGRRGLLPAQYPLPYASAGPFRDDDSQFIGREVRCRMPGRDRLRQRPAGADPHDGQRPEFRLVRRSGFPPRTVGGHRLHGPARAGGRGRDAAPRTAHQGSPIPMRSAWVRTTRSW